MQKIRSISLVFAVSLCGCAAAPPAARVAVSPGLRYVHPPPAERNPPGQAQFEPRGAMP